MDIYDMSQLQLAGLVGVALYLGSYAALQTGFLRGNGYAYAALNLAASSLVLISLFQDFNLSSALIQISWILISTVGMMRLWILRNSNSFTTRDMAFVGRKMNDLPGDLARKLLKEGEWKTLPAGYSLTLEGRPIPYLYYINRGTAVVVRDGETVAAVGENDFIGEMTCFTQAEATANVTAETQMEVFAISPKSLSRIAPAGSALRHAMELAIADDLRLKLTRRSKSESNDGARIQPPTHYESDETARLMNDLKVVTAA